MPSSQAILDGLSAIANEWPAVAVVWHVALGAMLLGLLAGWRPSNRRSAALLALPFVSVSVLAWTSGNPFNGTAFALLAVLLMGLASGMPAESVRVGSGWRVAGGVTLVAFGWVYPHFLTTESWTPYLYEAPLGVVPCPTLSVVIGITLVLDGLGSRAWSATLAAVGIVYGVIGAFPLGVTIDLALLAGAVVLSRLPHPR